jgi:hypothetical protein
VKFEEGNPVCGINHIRLVLHNVTLFLRLCVAQSHFCGMEMLFGIMTLPKICFFIYMFIYIVSNQ